MPSGQRGTVVKVGCAAGLVMDSSAGNRQGLKGAWPHTSPSPVRRASSSAAVPGFPKKRKPLERLESIPCLRRRLFLSRFAGN